MMNMNFENKNKISYTLLRLAAKLFEIDKKTRNYGTDKQLFEAEIHMIKSIKENGGIHVTGIAGMLGVTKGAVSQIIMRLQKKGMIIKDKDVNNQSRLVLRLSQKGETAYEYHEKLHCKFDDFVNEALGNATDENTVFLKDFLSSLEEKIDVLEKENNNE